MSDRSPMTNPMDQSFFPTRWTMLAGLICIAFAPLGKAGDSWPGFRGDGSGTAKADLPTQWSAEQGVSRQSDIPGYGQSSPVVWNDHVYVTSSEGPFQQDCQVYAFDLQTGEKLWTSRVAATTKVENYFRNSRAAPTCCVDDPSGIELRPMSKFPVVRDLCVDRYRLFRALEKLECWVPVDGYYDMGSGPKQTAQQQEQNYPLSQCMSCGCCLEACPQYQKVSIEREENESDDAYGQRLDTDAFLGAS